MTRLKHYSLHVCAALCGHWTLLFINLVCIQFRVNLGSLLSLDFFDQTLTKTLCQASVNRKDPFLRMSLQSSIVSLLCIQFLTIDSGHQSLVLMCLVCLHRAGGWEKLSWALCEQCASLHCLLLSLASVHQLLQPPTAPCSPLRLESLCLQPPALLTLATWPLLYTGHCTLYSLYLAGHIRHVDISQHITSHLPINFSMFHNNYSCVLQLQLDFLDRLDSSFDQVKSLHSRTVTLMSRFLYNIFRKFYIFCFRYIASWHCPSTGVVCAVPKTNYHRMHENINNKWLQRQTRLV